MSFGLSYFLIKIIRLSELFILNFFTLVAKWINNFILIIKLFWYVFTSHIFMESAARLSNDSCWHFLFLLYIWSWSWFVSSITCCLFIWFFCHNFFLFNNKILFVLERFRWPYWLRGWWHLKLFFMFIFGHLRMRFWLYFRFWRTALLSISFHTKILKFSFQVSIFRSKYRTRTFIFSWAWPCWFWWHWLLWWLFDHLNRRQDRTFAFH